MKQFLEQALERVLAQRKQEVENWIKPQLGYLGKIISLRARDQELHIVFTPQGIWLREGLYPSSEATIICESPELMLSILRKEVKLSELLRQGRAKLWGNLDDAQQFLDLLDF